MSLPHRRVLFALFIFALVSSGPGAASAGLVASGTLRGSDGTLIATAGILGEWADPIVTWSVDQTGDIFTYTYHFDSGNADSSAFLSHFAIEVSDNFGPADFLGGTTPGVELGEDGASPFVDGSGEGLNAAKWQVESNAFTAVIVTRRLPVWGDVFLKDGTVSAANSGYAAADPDSPVVGLGITGYGWLGVPDTGYVPAERQTWGRLKTLFR